jgi:hypothetical protein
MKFVKAFIFVLVLGNPPAKADMFGGDGVPRNARV